MKNNQTRSSGSDRFFLKKVISGPMNRAVMIVPMPGRKPRVCKTVTGFGLIIYYLIYKNVAPEGLVDRGSGHPQEGHSIPRRFESSYA